MTEPSPPPPHHTQPFSNGMRDQTYFSFFLQARYDIIIVMFHGI
jgi:hypothetical protein